MSVVSVFAFEAVACAPVSPFVLFVHDTSSPATIYILGAFDVLSNLSPWKTSVKTPSSDGV